MKENLLMFRNNSVSTWKVINSVLRGGSIPGNFKHNINNETISDPKLVSEAFNEHFNSIASKLAEEIPRVDIYPLSYVTGIENSFV